MDAAEARVYYTVVIGAIVLVSEISFFIGMLIFLKRKMVLSYKDRIFTDSLTAENERGRLAADLHDELGSSLAAIKLHLQCVEPHSSKEAESIAITERYIDNAMVKIREVANNLMPRVLQYNNFFIAAQEFCETNARIAKIQLRFQYEEPVQIIAKQKEIQLYRIMLEIITNALKHGKPAHIDVSLITRNDLLVMSISDDGKGFDKEIVKAGSGRGLHNIVNRVHLLQGIIYLDAAPGLGTDYRIEIPL